MSDEERDIILGLQKRIRPFDRHKVRRKMKKGVLRSPFCEINPEE